MESSRTKYRSISKKLAFILRHNPEAFGISLNREGWASIEDIERKAGIRREDILETVKRQGKKRFEIRDAKIRALYGHSYLRVSYQPVKPPDILYHGTSPENAKKILREGLKPMGRFYVHLTMDIKGASDVGKRHSKTQVILKIRAKDAHKAGIKFYPAGDLFLADYIPPQFIEILSVQT